MKKNKFTKLLFIYVGYLFVEIDRDCACEQVIRLKYFPRERYRNSVSDDLFINI